MNAYKITIISNDRRPRAPWTKNYPEVCEGCAKGIVNIIDALKEKTNG